MRTVRALQHCAVARLTKCHIQKLPRSFRKQWRECLHGPTLGVDHVDAVRARGGHRVSILEMRTHIRQIVK